MQSKHFSWLHLTDFHFGLDGQKFLWPNLRQPFLNDLMKLHEQTGPWQAVLFTGGLVQQGKSAEFQEMQKDVLDRLWEKLAELGSGDAVLLAVPGNHDLYRPNPKEDNAAIDSNSEHYKNPAKRSPTFLFRTHARLSRARVSSTSLSWSEICVRPPQIL